MGSRISFLKGFPNASASVAWSGTYLVAWRYTSPYTHADIVEGHYTGSVTPPSSFLAVSHVLPGQRFDPITFSVDRHLGQRCVPWAEVEPPALALNRLGTELIIIDEIRNPGDGPRALAYTSADVTHTAQIPGAPIGVNARAGSEGEIITWNRTSDNERGFVIIGRSHLGSVIQIEAPPGATSATPGPSASDGCGSEVVERSGISPPATFNLLPPGDADVSHRRSHIVRVDDENPCRRIGRNGRNQTASVVGLNWR